MLHELHANALYTSPPTCIPFSNEKTLSSRSRLLNIQPNTLAIGLSQKISSCAKNLAYYSELVACGVFETMKSLQRCTLADCLDTSTLLGSFIALGYLGEQHTSKVLQSDNISIALKNLCYTSTLFTAQSLTILALWGAQFYMRHHVLKDIGIHSREHHQSLEPLLNTIEAKDISSDSQALLTRIVQQSETRNNLPKTLQLYITQEVLLGNWKLNGAFLQFNESAREDLPFGIFHNQCLEHLPPRLGYACSHAVAQQDIQTIKQLLGEMPAATKQSFSSQILNLFHLRVARNITTFLMRGIREARQTPSAYEHQWIRHWLKELAQAETLLNSDHETVRAFHTFLNDEKTPQKLFEEVSFLHKELKNLQQPPLFQLFSKGSDDQASSIWSKSLEKRFIQPQAEYRDQALHNIENLPKQGRTELVFSPHSLYALDMPQALLAIKESGHRTAGQTRMVVDEALVSTPLVGSTLHSAGYRVGEKKSFFRMLAGENLVGVAPGGAREGFKPYDQANRLQWKNAKGFVRIHVATGSPLVPIHCPQADQVRRNILTPRLRKIHDLIYTWTKLPILPFLFAPWESRKVRLDHFIEKPYEAAPLPVNNLSMKDMRFQAHVQNEHTKFTEKTQAQLLVKDALVRNDTPDKSYPIAGVHDRRF